VVNSRVNHQAAAGHNGCQLCKPTAPPGRVYHQVHGAVSSISVDGAADQAGELSQRCFGKPFR
jgi:hypothetical protein